MKLREALDLLKFQGLELDRQRRVVTRSEDISDLRRAAMRHLPKGVFDYVDGGADDERTMASNRAAFDRWQLAPRLLEDVSGVDLSCTLFGSRLRAPIGLAPTGYSRMMHPEGEVAASRAAESRGVPYCLSTMGTTTMEEIAGLAVERWFQLYVMRDRDLSRSLVVKAAENGFRVLEITVDTPVAGLRRRDHRNGLTIPPSLSLQSMVDIGRHVSYWTAMLRSPALSFASLPAVSTGDPVAFANLFDPSFNWQDVAELRRIWQGPLLLKGPFGPEDARRAIEMGVDGIHLSNHGGRQLDRCVPSLDMVQPVRQALGGDVPIIVDSGIRHGTEVAIAIAPGADLCMVGRPYLYGLAAAGQAGVAKAIDLLTAELERAMILIGVSSLADLRKHGDEVVVPAASPIAG